MARILHRALPLATIIPPPSPLYRLPSPPLSPSLLRTFHVLPRGSLTPLSGFFPSLRGFRKTRGRLLTSKKQSPPPPPKDRELHLSVNICIEDDIPNDPEILNIAEMLKLNVPMAMKIAFDGLKDSEYKTRDTALTDVSSFDKIELSLLLCNDDFIQKLNKEWRGVDSATDVLSMSQHIPNFDIPNLMLGDVVVSVETAARQAEERGHTLLDEIRILMVHGLLHLLGFDHELSEEGEAEMGKEEELVLRSLGWKGNGLIKSAYDSIIDETPQPDNKDV